VFNFGPSNMCARGLLKLKLRVILRSKSIYAAELLYGGFSAGDSHPQPDLGTPYSRQ